MTISIWIAIAALAVATTSASFTAANYLAGHRERRLRSGNIKPGVKAFIDGRIYADGWRLVLVTVVPTEGNPEAFESNNWEIEQVRLVRPKGAVLARAKDDNHKSGEFHSDMPRRSLAGKKPGQAQRFALRFFMKFGDPQSGQRASFKVAIRSKDKKVRRTLTANAGAPPPRG